jgi:non-ribosomal peptide synthase protein (TIGR01720 family)
VASTSVSPFPIDHPGGINTADSTELVTVALDADETEALLREVPLAYNTQINDVLLTALAVGYREWSGKQPLLVDVEGHGRTHPFEEVDVSRTVGWFTSLFPVVLKLDDAQGPGESIKAIKEQLRAIPSHGLGYGLLRYMGPAEVSGPLRNRIQAGLLFNYLGQIDVASDDEDSLFLRADVTLTAERSGAMLRAHPVEWNAAVVAGRLRFTITYSRNLHRRESMERVAHAVLDALRWLISHCQQPDAGGYTPSDFPEANLTQTELDELVGELDES